MKILAITAYSLHLNTSGTLQNLIIIEGLKRLGHSIDVLTTEIPVTHEAYDQSLSLENIDNYYELKLPNIYTALRSKKKQNVLITFGKKIIKNVYNEIQVLDGYAKAADNLDDIDFGSINYDCVISFSDPKSSHVIAQKFIEKFKLHDIPWIQYWGDPLYYDISRKKKKFLEAKVKITERNLIQNATKIVYATPFTSKQQKQMYSEYSDKIDYATQGYWNDYKSLSDCENSNFTVGYFGSFTPNTRNILPLYNAISELNDVQLSIGGSGLPLENKENIKLLGRLRHDEVRESEQKCDVLVCLLNSRGTQIPGKLYYYACINKPLLVIVDGENGAEMKQFLNSFNRFVFCNNNEESIKKAIIELKNTSKQFKLDISEKFEPEYIANRILEGVVNEQ